MKSIKQFYQKIKGVCLESKEEIVVSCIIIFVGLSSFGLGQLSVKNETSSEIKIQNSASVVIPVKNDLQNEDNSKEKIYPDGNMSGIVVASKSGKKYHFPWCSGAKQISPKNKITFNSTEEARSAGYTPASNCKGLK